MIEHFGGFNARNVLNQDNIHSPKNAFTASIDPHEMFDQLDIWLTPAMVCHLLLRCDHFGY